VARIVRYDACVLYPAPLRDFLLSDFPASALGQFEIEALHPDEFIVRNWDLSPDVVLGADRRQRAGLTSPPRSAAEYLETLEKCRLRETASRFRQHSNEIEVRGR
jgi:hypothetical protein